MYSLIVAAPLFFANVQINRMVERLNRRCIDNHSVGTYKRKVRETSMPKPKARPNRKRSVSIRVMMTEAERDELQRAADKADMSLSGFVRALALTLVRRGETVAEVVTTTISKAA
jgi:hypothetical protein